MEDRLKFRAWNIPNKYMYNNVQDGVIAENEKGELIIGLSFGKLCRDKGSIVMQNTGLKDKNGKEIYESDIVKTTFTPPYIVTYKDGKFVGVTGENLAIGDVDLTYGTKEVIANIYENPEYLTNKK